jgi:hypothetical protein
MVLECVEETIIVENVSKSIVIGIERRLQNIIQKIEKSMNKKTSAHEAYIRHYKEKEGNCQQT